MSNCEPTVSSSVSASGTIYNRIFWLTYVANLSLVTANALTFRFAELVAYLGGTERVAGSIVSLGVIGALTARLVLGQALDRYGVRLLWAFAAVLFVGGSAAFLFGEAVSWQLYAARIAFAVGLAGMFTCSMVFIQNQVPAHRRTEVIGSLGSSGFLGMIVGTQLGDWIFHTWSPGQGQFVLLFGGAAGLGALHLAIVVFLTRKDVHNRPDETPGAHRLVVRYWPGSVVLAAMMMGISFTVTSVFLTRFSTHWGLRGIGTFFTVYSGSAFVFRIGGRRWNSVIGRHLMILLALGGMGVGFSLLPFVRSEWHFVLPAVACGFGHALIFPAVVSLGAGAFPQAYRGTGTTIVLGFTEVGAMISAPVLGGIIDHFGFTPMFFTVAGTAVGIGVFYALTGARQPDDDVLASEPATQPAMVPSPETVASTSPDEHDDSVPVPCPNLGRGG